MLSIVCQLEMHADPFNDDRAYITKVHHLYMSCESLSVSLCFYVVLRFFIR